MNLVERINKRAKEWGIDLLIVELGERVLYDEHPPLEEAYLFANTEGNEASLFSAAVRMQAEGLAKTFLITDGVEANGTPGYDKWSKKLGEAVGASNVKPVEIKDKYKVNTITEAQALAARSQKLDVQASYIVTAPFHQLRAMMTVASEAIRIEQKGGNPFSIYNYIGDELPWDEVVTHSQGDLTATREKLVWHEMKRIKTYSAKGDILPVRAILNYMDRRVVRI